jgi:predicted nucleic acid-binding protein
MPQPLRHLIGSGAAYGALGFAAGFAFGALRQLILIPAFGDRMGHLIEFPMVTLAACAIGVWIGCRTTAPALATGLLGVAVLIAFESTMALGFMRVSLSPAYSATWKDAHRSLTSLLSRPEHRFLPDDVSATESPESGYKDTTDAHLIRLASRHGLKLATLDNALISKPWAAGFAYHPLRDRV